MKLSLTYLTARVSDSPMIGRPGVHLLTPLLESLERQSFTDFELILVDTLWERRDLLAEATSLGNWSFPISLTHPTPGPGASGGWSKQSSANNGLVKSCGEWILQCDDCCEFPDDMLSKMMDATQLGSPHLLCAYKINDKIMTKIPDDPLAPDTVEKARELGLWNNDACTRDSRWSLTEASPAKEYLLGWGQCYAYGCFRRESLFRVNGWDERFDGSKPLGDVELGSRLELCGLWDAFTTASLFVYENQHIPCDQPSLPGCTSPWSNYDLLTWMRQNSMWRANTQAIPEDDCKRICNCELTGVDARPEKFLFQDPDENWPRQKAWMRNQKIMELTSIDIC